MKRREPLAPYSQTAIATAGPKLVAPVVHAARASRSHAAAPSAVGAGPSAVPVRRQGLADVELGWSAHYATIDGRSFLLTSYGEWEGTKIYEIDEDGTATEHLDIVGGTATGWRRVR